MTRLFRLGVRIRVAAGVASVAAGLPGRRTAFDFANGNL